MIYEDFHDYMTGPHNEEVDQRYFPASTPNTSRDELVAFLHHYPQYVYLVFCLLDPLHFDSRVRNIMRKAQCIMSSVLNEIAVHKPNRQLPPPEDSSTVYQIGHLRELVNIYDQWEDILIYEDPDRIPKQLRRRFQRFQTLYTKFRKIIEL